MGTASHLRILRESYLINTNMTGFTFGFQKLLHPCALDKSSLSTGRVKNFSRTSLLDLNGPLEGCENVLVELNSRSILICQMTNGGPTFYKITRHKQHDSGV